jgi:glycosyltransferase involved in cell wall biosynthesis
MKVKFAAILYYYKALVSIAAYLFRIKHSRKSNSIVFLENFPKENAGYQYRAAKWVPYLEAEGFKVNVWTIVESKAEFDDYIKDNRIGFMIRSMRKRFRQIIKSRHYGTVIVRRELLLYNDYGNLFMEKLLLKIHPNAILDFDDDIAAAKKQPRKITNFYAKLLQEHGDKFNASLLLYRRFIVGSSYLRSLVLERSPNTNTENVTVIPTCVDYDKYPAKKQFSTDGVTRFVWIGGDHNLPLLKMIIPALNEVSKQTQIELILISGTAIKMKTDFPVHFNSWALNKEVELIKQGDIGLMPTTGDARGRGKCGFKLIQYMGLGIPALASNVGANSEIVDHDVNGWLVDGSAWEKTLRVVCKNNNLQSMGKSARRKIIENYTFNANQSKYLAFIKQSD